MAVNYWVPLTNSRGLGRAIFFSGLAKPAVIVPVLLDTPLLTAPPFYFLGMQECVMKFRFDEPDADEKYRHSPILEQYLEILADNYLFRLSRVERSSRMSAKLFQLVLRPAMTDSAHFAYDEHRTQCLALDPSNSDSIVRFNVGDDIDEKTYSEYEPFKELVSDARQLCIKSMQAAMARTATVVAEDDEYFGTGTFEVPIITTSEPPLTRAQIETLEVVEPLENPRKQLETIVARRYDNDPNALTIGCQDVVARDYYDSELLAYYFSALRDRSPLTCFKSYYNVLEFFFDTVAYRTEREQLTAVLRSFVDDVALAEVCSLDGGHWAALASSPQVSTSGEAIPSISRTPNVAEFSERLYAIRNACIHSKRTRKGKVEPRIVPSTTEEGLLRTELPILQELAGRCIERFGRLDAAPEIVVAYETIKTK